MKKKKEQGDNQATIAIDASSMEKPPINPIKWSPLVGYVRVTTFLEIVLVFPRY